jgi:hypothetical protein
MTSTIGERQNRPYALELLAVQRALYGEVRRLRRLRITLLATGAISSMALAFTVTAARPPVGLVSGLGLLLLSLVTGGRERRRQQQAAAVQEEFDTYVLALPWNTLLVDHPPTDLVARASVRCHRKQRDGDLTDWYAPADESDRTAAVLRCQRANVSWNASLHRTWAKTLGSILGLIALSVVVLWLAGVVGITDLAVAVIAPLLAPVYALVETLRDNVAHARQIDRLHEEILRRCRTAAGKTAHVSEHDCRQIQDRLFQLRAAGPLVPDRLYRLRRIPLEEVVKVQARHLEVRCDQSD